MQDQLKMSSCKVAHDLPMPGAGAQGFGNHGISWINWYFDIFRIFDLKYLKMAMEQSGTVLSLSSSKGTISKNRWISNHQDFDLLPSHLSFIDELQTVSHGCWPIGLGFSGGLIPLSTRTWALHPPSWRRCPKLSDFFDKTSTKVTGIFQESRKVKGSVMLIEEIAFINEMKPVSGNSDEALYPWWWQGRSPMAQYVYELVACGVHRMNLVFWHR